MSRLDGKTVVAVGVCDGLTTALPTFATNTPEPESYALVRLNVRKIAF
jgi:hypothetical protein